jgi:signal transduction histidine kinase
VTNIVRNTTRVLRSVIIFRLLLIVFGVLLVVVRRPPLALALAGRHASPMNVLFLAPTVLTSLFLLIRWLEKPFGRLYLPIALVLTILDFSVQYGAAYLGPNRVGYVLVTLPSGQQISFFWASIEIILLILLPCMLAGTAYGLRSAVLASSLATVLHLLLGAIVWQAGLPLEGFLVLLPVRIGTLYAFPMIAGAMADTWRREHADLELANRQLRGYAATAEHLATSRERVRLARAMHDTLAHSLSALTVQLEALDTLHETDPSAARTQLGKIRKHARVGLDEARRAIFDLRSAPIEEFGLPGALERLVEQFGRRNGIRTDWSPSGDPFPLLPAQANALYRIVEEALDNVERHAEADEVTVELRYGRGVQLFILDNGQGFDPNTVDTDRYGLVGLYERAALIDGIVSVDSEPGHGTTVTVEIAEPWRE